MDFLTQVVVFLAFVLAGSVNAIAGGGTVFSFTALAWAGLPLVQANATNATALVPGSLGSALAFRKDLRSQGRVFLILLVPTILGSLFGAFVVANTPEAIFRRIVPFLVLFATLVFASRNFLTRLALQRRAEAVVKAPEDHISPMSLALGCVLQFAIALYGGYFGAGIGILMLTSMSVMGMSNIYRMNALKNPLAIAINGTASLFFIASGRVIWPVAWWAAIGALIGGYVVARIARRLDQDLLRTAVIVAGLVVTVWMFVRL